MIQHVYVRHAQPKAEKTRPSPARRRRHGAARWLEYTGRRIMVARLLDGHYQPGRDAFAAKATIRRARIHDGNFMPI